MSRTAIDIGLEMALLLIIFNMLELGV